MQLGLAQCLAVQPLATRVRHAIVLAERVVLPIFQTRAVREVAAWSFVANSNLGTWPRRSSGFNRRVCADRALCSNCLSHCSFNQRGGHALKLHVGSSCLSHCWHADCHAASNVLKLHVCSCRHADGHAAGHAVQIHVCAVTRGVKLRSRQTCRAQGVQVHCAKRATWPMLVASSCDVMQLMASVHCEPWFTPQNMVFAEAWHMRCMQGVALRCTPCTCSEPLSEQSESEQYTHTASMHVETIRSHVRQGEMTVLPVVMHRL